MAIKPKKLLVPEEVLAKIGTDRVSTLLTKEHISVHSTVGANRRCLVTRGGSRFLVVEMIRRLTKESYLVRVVEEGRVEQPARRHETAFRNDNRGYSVYDDMVCVAHDVTRKQALTEAGKAKGVVEIRWNGKAFLK